MIESRILIDRGEIERLIPACMKLQIDSQALLPFNFIHLPLLWWDCFNNLGTMSNTTFSELRGGNFLGAQSWLKNFYLLISEDNGVVVGAVPLVEFSVKVSGHPGRLKILSFAGDQQLMPYQDFLILPSAREEILASMFQKLKIILEERYDLLSFNCIPDNSLNLQFIRNNILKLTSLGIASHEKVTSQRGGIWSWTLKSLIYNCKRIIEKNHKNASNLIDLRDFIRKLENEKLTLFFPATRKSLEDEIVNILSEIEHEFICDEEINEIKKILSHQAIAYPYVVLPADRETYLKTLKGSCRKAYRKNSRRFLNNGGYFEKISAKEITDQDIADYISLHLLRWEKGSASIKTSQTTQFHTEICKALADQGHLTLFFANHKGNRIGVNSCIDIFPRREGYLAGRDPNPEFSSFGIGRLLNMEYFFDAIDNGFDICALGGSWGNEKMDYTEKYHTSRSFLITSKSDLPEIDRLFSGFLYLGNDSK